MSWTTGVTKAAAVGLACLLGVTGCSGSSRPESAAQIPRKPNVLFILVDDLDNTTMPFWKAMPRTRELIADQGVNFTNAFATNPVCCPARASILTGKYSHNTGVYDHTPPDGGYATFVSTGAEQDTVATRLHAAGYRTAFMGKYLNGYEKTPEKVPPGWDEWFGLSGRFLDGYTYGANHNGRSVRYGSEASDYQTDVLSKQAATFLESTEKADRQPFFLFLSPSAPHATIGAAPRDRDNEWNDAERPRRENYNELDVSDKPSWLRLGKPQLDSEQEQSLTRGYRRAMASLLAVDDMVSSVVKKLRTDGELDNTMLIFTSDNGNNWGAHRLNNKQVPYEESIRIPLAIAGPGIRHETSDALVTHIDDTPTVLDLAGLDASDLDGRSLLPLLRGDDVPWRNDFLIEYSGTYNLYYSLDTYDDVRYFTDRGKPLRGPPTYRALRTESHLYVEWYKGAAHEYELYDLDKDPYELENLLATDAGKQANATLAAALQSRIDALTKCAGPACRS